MSHALVALVSITVTIAVMLGIFFVKLQGRSKLDALEELIDVYFIGEVDKTAMEDAAASAMIGALGDRWSYYIPADQYAAYMEQMSNSYVGIGVTITPEEDGSIGIVEVTVGGPAEESGLQVGDKIVGVDGQSILGMSLNEIQVLIKGEENTTVDLMIVRGGEELTLTVTRRTIRTVVAKGELLEGNIGLITIANFNSNCASETIAAIEMLIGQGAEKLIFDVRDNPGGYAQELVKVLDYLLPEGKLFTTVDYTGKENTDMSDAACLEMPMAVLVNGNSYSAAEFFAAAMAEYEAAVIVGEKTSGKGYFQNAFKLSDNSMVLLSVGKYFTPNGISLTDVGITPQVIVPVTEKIASQIQEGTLVPMQDPQILAAIEALKAK